MKRILAVIMLVMMLFTAASAETKADPNENRNIQLAEVSDHTAPAGESPTTGRQLADLEIPKGAAGLAVTGRYMPMMVQISNPLDDKTKASGCGNRSPWGLQYADVIYELQLHVNGETRMSALFSDIIPEAVGPIRSARMGNVWLREEWDCGFMYYGQQEYKQTNVIDAFRDLGADNKGLLFPGTVGSGKPWKSYYETYVSKRLHNSQLKKPNHVSGNAAEISKMIDPVMQATNHTWLFTDEKYTGGDSGVKVYVNWGRKDTNSYFTYDADKDAYIRSVESAAKKSKPVVWAELESPEPLTFNNVIIQWAPTVFLGNDAPVVGNVKTTIKNTKGQTVSFDGEGNAEIFMNGRHIAGYWKRLGMNQRTVFYDENGQEIQFQRGTTFIVQMNTEKEVIYE